MKKKSLIIVFLLISVVVIAMFGFRIFQKATKKMDPTIKDVADRYIISLIGKSEFVRNYAFDNKNSEKCKDNNQIGGCYVRYKFLPADKYGGSEYLFFYNFSNNQIAIANNNIPKVLPSCEKDRNKCNFKVSLEELKEIARRENLGDRIELVMDNDEIVAEISYCNLETTENRRKIFVSLQNGSIIWSGLNSECQGIN